MLRQKEFFQIDQDNQTQNKLYLCDQQSIHSLYQINLLNILTVIQINSSIKQLSLKHLTKQNIKIFIYDDANPKFSYTQFFDLVSDQIASSISKGNVAIFCTFKGYNASAACCISYLMRFRQMKYEQAFYDLKTQNYLINISVEFKRELIIYKTNLMQTATWLTNVLKTAPHKHSESNSFTQRFSRTESQRVNNKTSEQEFSFQYHEEPSFGEMNQTLQDPQIAQFTILDETEHIPTFNFQAYQKLQKSTVKTQSQPPKSEKTQTKPINGTQLLSPKDSQTTIAPSSKTFDKKAYDLTSGFQLLSPFKNKVVDELNTQNTSEIQPEKIKQNILSYFSPSRNKPELTINTIGDQNIQYLNTSRANTEVNDQNWKPIQQNNRRKNILNEHTVESKTEQIIVKEQKQDYRFLKQDDKQDNEKQNNTFVKGNNKEQINKRQIKENNIVGKFDQIIKNEKQDNVQVKQKENTKDQTIKKEDKPEKHFSKHEDKQDTQKQQNILVKQNQKDQVNLKEEKVEKDYSKFSKDLQFQVNTFVKQENKQDSSLKKQIKQEQIQLDQPEEQVNVFVKQKANKKDQIIKKDEEKVSLKQENEEIDKQRKTFQKQQENKKDTLLKKEEKQEDHFPKQENMIGNTQNTLIKQQDYKKDQDYCTKQDDYPRLFSKSEIQESTSKIQQIKKNLIIQNEKQENYFLKQEEKQEQLIKTERQEKKNISPIRTRRDQTAITIRKSENNNNNIQIEELVLKNPTNTRQKSIYIQSEIESKVPNTIEFKESEIDQNSNGIQASIIKQISQTERKFISNSKNTKKEKYKLKEEKNEIEDNSTYINQTNIDLNHSQMFYKVNLPQSYTVSSKNKVQEHTYNSYISDTNLTQNEYKTNDEQNKRENAQKSPLKGFRQSTSSGIEQRYQWRESLLSNYESTERLLTKKENNQNYRWRVQGLNSSTTFMPLNQQTSSNIMDKRNSNGNVQDQMETQSLGEYRKKYFTACIYKKQY